MLFLPKFIVAIIFILKGITIPIIIILIIAMINTLKNML